MCEDMDSLGSFLGGVGDFALGVVAVWTIATAKRKKPKKRR